MFTPQTEMVAASGVHIDSACSIDADRCSPARGRGDRDVHPALRLYGLFHAPAPNMATATAVDIVCWTRRCPSISMLLDTHTDRPDLPARFDHRSGTAELLNH